MGLGVQNSPDFIKDGICVSNFYFPFWFLDDFQEEKEVGTSSSHLKTGSPVFFFIVFPKARRLAQKKEVQWKKVSIQKSVIFFFLLVFIFKTVLP